LGSETRGKEGSGGGKHAGGDADDGVVYIFVLEFVSNVHGASTVVPGSWPAID
jgi:hypothetical protein